MTDGSTCTGSGEPPGSVRPSRLSFWESMARILERLRGSPSSGEDAFPPGPFGGWYERSRVVLWAFVGSRAVVVAAAFVSGWIALPSAPPEVQAPPWWAPLNSLASWDADLYLILAERGYEVGDKLALDRFAFFPLWPIVLRLIEAVVPFLGLLPVGVVLANLLGLAGALRLKSFVGRETGSTATGDRAAVYLLVFPSAFALSMPYAEALFILLSVTYLDLLRRERWGWTMAVGILAGLTRPGGWLLALPAVWEGAQRLVHGRTFRGSIPALGGSALAAAGPVAGFAAYLGYAGWRTGDPLLPLQRQWQEGWKVRPRFFLDSALDKADQLGELGVTPDAVLGFMVLLAFALALYAFRLLPSSMAAYGASVIALGASTHVLVGVTRVILVAVPLFWALAVLGERRGFDAVWRPLSMGLMGVLALAAYAMAWVP